MPWLVHAYTACGALLALLALLATDAGDYRLAFAWLALATLIDASDGWLARTARVKERLPRFDGALLDNIVDYLTFTFVPTWMLLKAGALPEGWGLAVAAVVLLSSAYGFSHADAKTTDHFFTGFPSYWNIVALYLIAIGFAPLVNAVVLMVLSVLVFVPIRYIYPSRTPTLRVLSLALGAMWGAMAGAIIALLPAPPAWLVWGSLAYPGYYAALSVWLHFGSDGRGMRPAA